MTQRERIGAAASEEQAVPAFEYCGLASRVIMAPGAVERVPDEIRWLKCERVMLFCGGKTARGALVARIRSLLGARLVETCERIPEHSSTATVEQAAERARASRADALLAVGGGSASDSAKAVAILLAEGAPLERHANTFTPPDRYVQRDLRHPKLPIIAVPTTLSAAEVTPGLGVRDASGSKLLFWDPKLVPQAIVLDPEANLEVPVEVMASTGMNAFAHCIEGLYSRVRNPISEGLALQGIRLLHQALPEMAANPASEDARARALVGAHLSGMVIANARVGIHHGVCHCLGAFGGLSHGIANAIFLPHAMRFNCEVTAPELKLAALAMGLEVMHLDPFEAAGRAIEATERLQQSIRVPRRLRDAGLRRELLPEIARHAVGDRGLYFNPRPAASADVVLGLLEQAW